MLVLTRTISEAIVAGNISDDDGVPQMVKITVLEISGGSVRLGIEAPARVAVLGTVFAIGAGAITMERREVHAGARTSASS